MIQKKHIIIVVAVLVCLMILPYILMLSRNGISNKNVQTEPEGYTTKVLAIEPFSSELINALTAQEYDAFKANVFDYLAENDGGTSVSVKSVKNDNENHIITIESVDNKTNKPLNIVITYTETLVLITINNTYKTRLL